jgi:hypothetical protein
MDLSTSLILAVAALLGLNHMVFRLPGWEHRRVVFWGLQSLNLVCIVALLTVGIPGFAGATKPINWVLGLLLVFHVVTNNGRLLARLRAGDTGDEEETNRKREQFKTALQRSSEE